MQHVCAVCMQPDEGGVAMNRIGGADVCDQCFLGAAGQRVRHRGWKFTISQSDVVSRNGDETWYMTRAVMRLPVTIRVEFVAQRKDAALRVLSLFLPGVRSGDALFDREIRTTSRTPEIVRTLLADEGVKSILLGILGQGSWLKLKNGTIEVQSSRKDFIGESQFFSEMAVFAAHIDRIQAGTTEGWRSPT